MPSAREQMKTINEELGRVRAEIERLKIEEEILERLVAKMSGEPLPVWAELPKRRARSASIKPVVLVVVGESGQKGMTSQEVAAYVKERVPDVAKDTVGSTLSRLKADGAFVYENERYYEKQYAPSRAMFLGPKPAYLTTAN